MPTMRSITKQDIGEFSLQKYVGLEEFTMRQWHMVVMQRRLLWLHRKWIASVSVDPERVRAFLADPLGCASSSSLYVFPNIKPIPDVYKGAIPGDPGGIDATYFGMLDGIPVGQLHRNDADGRRVVHLEVDMDAPNAELMENFAQWISSYRKIRGEVEIGAKGSIRPSTKNIRRDWINAKLIPYLDLLIAARFQRLKLSENLTRAELFPRLTDEEWMAKEQQLKRLQKKFFETEGDMVLHQLDQ